MESNEQNKLTNKIKIKKKNRHGNMEQNESDQSGRGKGIMVERSMEIPQKINNGYVF